MSWVSMQGEEYQQRYSQVRRGINEPLEIEEAGDPPGCLLLEEAQPHLISSSRSEKKTHLLYFKLTSFCSTGYWKLQGDTSRQTETQDACQSPQHLNLVCLHLSQHPWLAEADIFIFQPLWCLSPCLTRCIIGVYHLSVWGIYLWIPQKRDWSF